MWKETGMAVDYQVEESTGFYKLRTSEAIEHLEQLLNVKMNNVVVGRIIQEDLEKQPLMRPIIVSDRLRERVEKVIPDESKESKEVIQDKFESHVYENEDGLTFHERELAVVWMQAMKIENLSLYDNFYDLGGNSLMAVHLLNKLNQAFPDMFKVSDIYSYPTVFSMAKFLDEKKGVQISDQNDEIDDILAGLERGDVSREEAFSYLDKR